MRRQYLSNLLGKPNPDYKVLDSRSTRTSLSGVRKMPYDEPIECPLCMEPLDIDDLNFYPCTCGYQICRFCWHRIRTDENSLCPACRKQYQEDPAEFKPLTEEELTKIKKERRQKDAARKQKAAENRRHLANIRVVQKNLVFVVGLSNRLADTEVLKRQEYFGKYGKILKVVINSSTSYAGAQGPSASAYITYTRPEDCLRAIHAVNNLYVDGRTLKASLGTTKYCSHFLKGTQCTKTDCMYLHDYGDGEASFTKEEMQSGKHQDYEQKLADTYLTPQTPNPNLATQLSTSSSRSATGDAGTNITNGPTSSNNSKSSASNQRKKTDSGSSGGSGKSKEPWPMLNSNNSTSNTSSSSGTGNGGSKKQANSSGVSTTTCVVTCATTTTVSTVCTSATEREAVITNSGDIPANSGQKACDSLTDNTTKHNGLSHSSPSSTCSSISNPRTPTPEASSVSPNFTQTSTVHTSGGTEDTQTDTQTQQQPRTVLPSITAPSEPNTTSSITLQAVRKLPFSEPELETATESPAVRLPGEAVDLTALNNSLFASNSLQSQHRLPGAPGLRMSHPDNTTLPSEMPAPGLTADWPDVALSDNPSLNLASDDDLGFDPFLESNKGLADMLENEGGNSLGHHPHRMASPLAGFGMPSLHRPPPGVGLPQLPLPGAPLFAGAGMIPGSVVPMSSSVSIAPSVSSSASSALPPPPPGLTAPGIPAPSSWSPPQSFPLNSSVPNRTNPAELPGFTRGSRMLGLMNLGGVPSGSSSEAPPPHMMPQSPNNTIPRSPYNDSRLNSIQPPSQPPASFGSAGFSNGMPEVSSFNTQDLRESLKALLPNASINFAPGIPSHQPTQLQHSRLRNNYMQPPPSQQQSTSSWNDSLQHHTSSSVGSSALDDQFSDPAIVSGCLSSDTSNSPPSAQPHWLRSIQQLTENDSSPVKPPVTTQQQVPPLPHTLPFRQPQTHSRMPFAQNIHLNQPGHVSSGWPSLQPHNPPPGFQTGFRTASQNSHMTTLES